MGKEIIDLKQKPDLKNIDTIYIKTATTLYICYDNESKKGILNLINIKSKTQLYFKIDDNLVNKYFKKVKPK